MLAFTVWDVRICILLNKLLKEEAHLKCQRERTDCQKQQFLVHD